MKIVADENVEAEIIERLRSVGHDVIDIKATHAGISDTEVLGLASTNNAVLLTNDKDFGDLVYRRGLYSTGIVLLRFGRIENAERADLISNVFGLHTEDLVGSFIVVTRTGVRIRK